MRELWNGLLGRGEWRDLSWVVPLMLLLTSVVAAAVLDMFM